MGPQTVRGFDCGMGAESGGSFLPLFVWIFLPVILYLHIGKMGIGTYFSLARVFYVNEFVYIHFIY